MYLVNCFFIYSIFSFLLEGIFNLIVLKHFTSGILYGPWTPIYGVGAIITIVISKKIFQKLHKSQFIETLITFLILSVTLTLTEFLGGFLIEKKIPKFITIILSILFVLDIIITLLTRIK